MGNTIWSDNIQGILNLDLSREMRFRDDRKELFLNILGAKTGMRIADIGCGPGTLTRKLAKWLGEDAEIIGVDRDTRFINYAKSKALSEGFRSLSYFEGDALNLPLDDNSVDVCLSHTVIEHVPNEAFLIEQKRVCKPGGKVCVMYSRPDKVIRTEPDMQPKTSEREIELFERLFKGVENLNKKYSVGKYWPDPVKLPQLFKELGFSGVEIDAIAIPIAIDDSRYASEEKISIVEAEMDQIYESINLGIRLNARALDENEIDELKELVSDRFNSRINLIKDEISVWDYTVSIIQIVSGVK